MNWAMTFQGITGKHKTAMILISGLISFVLCLGILFYTLSLYKRELSRIESIVLIVPMTIFSSMILLMLLTPLFYLFRKCKSD